MNTDHVNKLLLAYINGNLDKQNETAVRLHIASCEQCRKEFESMTIFWDTLTELPPERPSENLRERFYDMLQTEIEANITAARKRSRGRATRNWLDFLLPHPALQAGFAILLVGVGLFAGLQLNRETPVQPVDNRNELSVLHEEVMTMNRLLTVSLLQQQSASERLKGISMSYKLGEIDPEIITALLEALKYDPNVNVRLAALDALTRDSSSAPIRQELIHSLPKQSSPLVQLALVDFIVQQKEKESLNTLQTMLKQPDINKAVKQRIEQGIQEINS